MNFNDLDRLIHSNIKRISLTHDVVLEDGEELVYKNGIVIDLDGLIIDGMGHTIDARGKTRIFNVHSHLQVIIVNMVFKNGSHSQGGAINSFSKFLTLGNCLFENNSADEGGAIYNHGFLKATNCSFRTNTSKYSEIHNWDTLILNGCDFKNETVIYNLNKVITRDCRFKFPHRIENNCTEFRKASRERFSESAKAAERRKQIDDLYLSLKETLKKFREDEIGYAHGNDEGNSISFSELKDMLSQNNEVRLDRDVVFAQGDGHLHDGIMLADSDCTNEDDSIVVLENDLVIEGNGHSIDARELAQIFKIVAKNVKVTFRNIVFCNASNNEGGAINNEGNCRFEYCEFKNNKAAVSGGAIYNFHGNMEFNECKFKSNASEGPAGVIFNNAGDLNFVKCIFKNNSSKDAGAVLCDFVGRLKFSGCCFKHNSTEFMGIIAIAHNMSFDFDASVFLENSVGKGSYIYKTSFWDMIDVI